MTISDIFNFKKKSIVPTNIGYFYIPFDEMDRMKKALSSRNLTASDVINVETELAKKQFIIWYRTDFEKR